MSKIHLVFGPQGAGKSTYSKKLADEVEGIHLSIDKWMWNFYGDNLPKSMNLKSMNLKWIMKRVERCEKQIWALSKDIFDRGCEVILDLGFTKIEKRKLFTQLATDYYKVVQ